MWAGQEHVWWLSDCENTNAQWRTVRDVAERLSSLSPLTWSLKSRQETHLHVTDTRKWETDYWTHFRCYTSTKSDFTLLIDCLSFILMCGVRFLLKFSYLNTTSATEVNRHLRPWWGGICSVYLSVTEQLSRSFFFSYLLFCSCRQGGTHTHTHKPTCLLSASISADRKVRDRGRLSRPLRCLIVLRSRFP